MNEGTEDPYCIVCNSSKVSVCTGCNKVYYCGTEHQNLHWPVHRRDCASSKQQHHSNHHHHHHHQSHQPQSKEASPSSLRKKSHDSLAVTGSSGTSSPSARNSPPPGSNPFSDSGRKSVAVSNIKQLQQQIQSLQQPQTGSNGVINNNNNNTTTTSSGSVTPSMVKKSAAATPIKPSTSSETLITPQSKVSFKQPPQQSQQQGSPQPIMSITNNNSIKAKQQQIQESLMKSNSSSSVSTTTMSGSGGKVLSPSSSISSSSSSISNTSTPITSPEPLNNVGGGGPPQYTPPQPKQVFIAPSPKSSPSNTINTPPTTKPRTSPPTSGYVPRTNTPPPQPSPTSFDSPISNTSTPSSSTSINNNNNEDSNSNNNNEEENSIKSLKNKLNQLNFNVGGPPPGSGYRKSVLSQSSSAVPTNSSTSSPIQANTLIPNPMTPPVSTYSNIESPSSLSSSSSTTTTTTNNVSFSNNNTTVLLPTSNSSGNIERGATTDNQFKNNNNNKFHRDHKKNQSLPEHMVSFYSSGSNNFDNNNSSNSNHDSDDDYNTNSEDVDEDDDFDNLKFRDRSRPRGLRTNESAVIEWESGTIEYKGNKSVDNRKVFLNHEKNKYQSLEHDDDTPDAILTTPIDNDKEQLQQQQQQQSSSSHHSRIAGKFRDIKKKANIISTLTKNKVSEVASKTKKSLSSTNDNNQLTDSNTTTTTTTTNNNSNNNNTIINENTIIFGLPLNVGIERSSTLHPLMPDIVYKCIEYIKERGMQEEGIFRISGSSSAITALKNEFNNGVDVDLSQQLDQHVVSGILKLYLRQIPETLFTNEFSEELEALREGGNSVEGVLNRARGLTQLLKFLPESNRCILHYLCSLLNNISFEPSSKMSNVNLAIVFAPTLGCSVEVMTTLISQYDAIFSEQTYSYQ